MKSSYNASKAGELQESEEAAAWDCACDTPEESLIVGVLSPCEVYFLGWPLFVKLDGRSRLLVFQLAPGEDGILHQAKDEERRGEEYDRWAACCKLGIIVDLEGG